jgi:hypothetical protein
VNLYIMEFTSTFRHFMSLRSKYSPQHLSPCYSLNTRDQVSHPASCCINILFIHTLYFRPECNPLIISLSFSSVHVSAVYGHHQVSLFAETVSRCSKCDFIYKAHLHGTKTTLLTGRAENTVKGAYVITTPTNTTQHSIQTQ